MTTLVKEFIIIVNGSEVFKSLDMQSALSEYSKQKYLLGFNTTVSKLKDDLTDTKILEYISENPETLIDSKVTKVLYERVHKNKAKSNRSRLVYKMKRLPDTE